VLVLKLHQNNVFLKISTATKSQFSTRNIRLIQIDRVDRYRFGTVDLSILKRESERSGSNVPDRLYERFMTDSKR
jgi:hypothetical protein